jgi:hypothetical protein
MNGTRAVGASAIEKDCFYGKRRCIKGKKIVILDMKFSQQ